MKTDSPKPIKIVTYLFCNLEIRCLFLGLQMDMAKRDINVVNIFVIIYQVIFSDIELENIRNSLGVHQLVEEALSKAFSKTNH